MREIKKDILENWRLNRQKVSYIKNFHIGELNCKMYLSWWSKLRLSTGYK